ncbi:MAG: DUF368 domain-containing protein [Waddliaceae bacterium]
MLKSYFFGLCMGLADLVPGVSGGTIAFVMGFYDDFIGSICSFNLSSLRLLVQGQWRKFSLQVNAKFLVPLGLGILSSIVIFARTMHFLLNHEESRTYLFAGFLGLILGSAYLLSKQLTWKKKHAFPFILGAIAAFLFTSGSYGGVEAGYSVVLTEDLKPLIPSGVKIDNYDQDSRTLKYLTWDEKAVLEEGSARQSAVFNKHLIFSGALAAGAMLVPGISGSYLLTVLGVYPVVIAAVAHFSLDILLNVAIGIMIGMGIFSRVISFLLARAPEVTFAALIGVMLGALRSVWPFWSYSFYINPLKLHQGLLLKGVDPVIPPIDLVSTWLSVGLMFAGFFVVVLLNRKVETVTAN